MRFKTLPAIITLILLSHTATAQTPAIQTIDSMGFSGPGANVALGKSASGDWKVYQSQ